MKLTGCGGRGYRWHANNHGNAVAYFTPTDLQDALAARAGGARPLAGGTDLYAGAGLLRGDLVDLSRIEALRGIERSERGWHIGATTTWAQIARADLPAPFAALQQAARRIGAVQVQNAATIGGNLVNASPAADGVVALMVLDGEVELVSMRSSRRLKLADFLRGPGETALVGDELLTSVRVPVLAGGVSAFVKLGARAHMVISQVMVAALVFAQGGRIRDVRVAVGACSPVACRLEELEAELADRPLAALAEPGLVSARHLAPLSPIDDLRAPAQYRLAAAARLVGDALRLAGHQAGQQMEGTTHG